MFRILSSITPNTTHTSIHYYSLCVYAYVSLILHSRYSISTPPQLPSTRIDVIFTKDIMYILISTLQNVIPYRGHLPNTHNPIKSHQIQQIYPIHRILPNNANPDNTQQNLQNTTNRPNTTNPTKYSNSTKCIKTYHIQQLYQIHKQHAKYSNTTKYNTFDSILEI